MGRVLKFALTGVAELDVALGELAAEEGPRSINAEMRRSLRIACKEIIKPKVLELIPVGSGIHEHKGDWYGGHLEDQIVIRAFGKRGKKVGCYVGFREPLFQGDTHYGGYIEFGWDHWQGGHVEADSFLRRALYPEAQRILSFVRSRMAAVLLKFDRA